MTRRRYRHRRLRRREVPAPKWVIRVPFATDWATVKLIREAWREAGRDGVLIVENSVQIERLR